MDATSSLLENYAGRHLQTPNRIVMAPMTRYRADPVTGAPGQLIATYYAQRAGAGLIITEGIWPSVEGSGGPGVPGLATHDQAQAWRATTEAVHAAGGRIFAQLWHVGRIGHPQANPDRRPPIAPSATRAPGSVHIGERNLPTVTAAAISRSDIASTVDAFTRAARRATDAGFDGVELHGANGYLIHQFLADNTNLRCDDYVAHGGRHRSLLELLDRVTMAIGPGRVALRISPGNREKRHHRAQPRRYLSSPGRGAQPSRPRLPPHQRDGDLPCHRRPAARMERDPDRELRRAPAIRRVGDALLRDGHVDLVAFGRLFIANPDLPARFATDAPLNDIDHVHLYCGGPKGYTDCPTIDSAHLSPDCAGCGPARG